MTSQNGKQAKAPASKTAETLDAPLTLSADQLELVAGGLKGSGSPIVNGLIRLAQ